MSQKSQQRTRVMGLMLCGAMAGILIWTKLRLATNVPRSAYADPEDQTQSHQDRPQKASNNTAEGASESSENDRHAIRVERND